MQGPVIVGWRDAEHSGGALACAASLAGALGVPLLLASVHPSGRALGAASRAYEDEQRARALRSLDEAAALAAPVPCEVRAIAAPSAPRGLHDLAEREGAAVLVVGPAHRGPVGRVLAGGTATRLLHGSPCPIVVVPRGYRAPHHGLRQITVALDAGEEARRALEAALALALACGAALRLIAVADPPGYMGLNTVVGVTWESVMAEARAELRGVLDAALAELPPGVAADAELYDGDPADTLAERTVDADLLVVGSRAYGPVGRVLMGSVATHLARSAHCPLLIVPRGGRSLDAPPR